ncbi:MAG: O-antigen ligase family protein [Flavobacteriales bacterium]
MLPNSITRKWLLLASGLFIALMTVCIYFEFFYILLLPIVLLIIWAAFYHLEHLLLFVALCTPFSINLEEMELGGIGVALPTEPLLVGILILFFFKVLSGKSIDTNIFKHPITIVLYFYLGWMTYTSITSEFPLVSFKYLATRLWFITSFYLIAAHVFQNFDRIRHYFLVYLFPLVLVVIYTIFRHSQYGFDKDSSHWVMEPLFKDHTSYGAVLAMYFPVIIGLLLSKKMGPLLRVLVSITFIILTAGLILSYTRAAWLSVVVAGGVLAVLLLRIRLRTILLSLFAIGFLVILSWDDIQIALEGNKQESSDKIEEHVSSISNVSSDASNLERLNRWNCALEMFKERPVLGWGPGTYQFVYAPFQRAKDRTIISTNRGDGGNAHSEYLGPLCEQGVFGMVMVIVLLLAVSNLAFRLFYSIQEFEVKLLIAMVYLGLITYFTHGVLNNYLDTDKASVPFWGFIAILVAIDLYHKHPKKIEEKNV